MDGAQKSRPLPLGVNFNWLTRLSKQKLIGFVLLSDLAILWSLGAVFATILLGDAFDEDRVALAVFIMLPFFVVYGLQRLWAYTIPALLSVSRQVRRILSVNFIVFGLALGGGIFFGVDMAFFRAWLMVWLAASLLFLPFARIGLARLLATTPMQASLARRAVIVGGGKACDDLIQRLEKSGSGAIHILGIFDDRGEARSPASAEGYRKIGTFDELEAYCRDEWVDLIIIALPPSAEERILHLMRKLWVLPLDVRIAAHQSRLKLSKRAYSYIGDVPFLAVFDRPLSDWDAAIKAVSDRVLAALLLLMLAPVMLLVALAIRLDTKGPVFFRQKRYGFNNNLIEVYKFRSMHHERADQEGRKQVTQQDARVTRVGRIIRKASLDELPQLFNVVQGSLSLVGPRPHATQSRAGNQLFQDVVDGYFARHRMKPGITGWAQINGWRGETDTREKIEKRVDFDLYYIENWSLVFDLYILLMTPVALLKAKNAY